jgi:flagellar hook-associated protein 1 FlgK
MGTLFGALNSSLQAIQAFQNALEISQNNVSNASTPGYADQIATFEASPFNLSGGLSGGVQSGPTQSTDNYYADQAVRNQLSAQGNASAQNTALSSIQSLFDTTGQTGVLGALNQLFSSFSAWSASPSSTASQQTVLSQAAALAQQFRSAADALGQTTNQLNQQISSAVKQINNLASQIATDNAALAQSHPPDAGVQANLEANLESLSKLADISVSYQANGTATITLGQGLLVVGTQSYAISANFSNAPAGGNPNAVADAQILDTNGNDLTGNISQGSLAGLLQVRNTVLPSLQGNGQQQGALNVLAQQVADRVNSILTSATTATGAAGVALFTYSNASPVDVAATLALNPAITTSTLAASNPGPPVVANGAALQLANLGSSTAAADTINGQTILQFAASTATNVGQQAATAQTNQTLYTQLLGQAQAVQTQLSGVSLDAEAVKVLELQKGYSAAGKMVSVIDSLATTLINMVPNA